MLLVFLLAAAGTGAWLFLQNYAPEQPAAQIHPPQATHIAPQATPNTIPPTSPPNISPSLSDTFDDAARSGLKSGTAASATYAFQAGTYAMTVADPNYIAWSPVDGVYSDGSVSIDLAFADGPRATAAGLVFRYQNPENFYFFSLSGDGYYALDVRENGAWRSLLEWTKWPTITGDGTFNRVQVEMRGDNIRLYLDGKLLDQASDSTFSSGGLALAVNTYDTGGATVLFDNLRVHPW
jgi:hypothetical protein